MGFETKGKCRKCGKVFRVRMGGGFCFHLLRCDTCGIVKSIAFDRLGSLHARYLKGLDVPYAVVWRHADEAARTACADAPISQRAYHAGVERIAGTCKCGGQHKFRARPRCPQCRSLSIRLGEIERFYD